MKQINWDCLNIVKGCDSALSETIKERSKYKQDIEKNLGIQSSAYRNRAIEPYKRDVKPFDIDEAIKLLPFDTIEEFKKQTEGFQVVGYDECEQALSMSLQSRKLSKVIEEKRKEITKPHLDFQRSIKKIADAFIDELKLIEKSMSKKVEDFNESRKEKSEEIGVDLKLIDSVKDGNSYEKECWKFDISNIEEIPKEYFKVDERAIKKAISNGIRSIPGLNIFKETKTIYRVK